MQVSAESSGASFDTVNHAYSVAFALGGKKGGAKDVVLKVPVILDDSNAGSLSVMVPPFLLKNESHGKADVFLVTDGIMSDTCLSRVNIGKLPKSASKVNGLVTLSWLRANHAIYSTAKPALASPQAAPFVNPEILGDIDKTIANVGNLIPTFTNLRGKAAKPLAKTAKQSDSLLTGLLTAGQKVGDSAFAAATTTWLQAMSGAKDSDDASLKSAEAGYANTLVSASGATAQSVAKFTVACGSVTSTGVAASATLFAGVGKSSGKIDAQATANVICGATLGATNVVCGLTAVTTRASAPGATTYGKTLLKGSVQTSASTKANYSGVSLGTAKVCGCPQPALQGVVTISITIINICDHIRKAAPTFCLPEGSPAEGHGGTTTTTIPVAHCDQQQGAAQGSTSDTRSIELGRTSGAFTFDYRTFMNKDHIIVSYEGEPLLDTGCVSTPDPNNDGTGPQVSQPLSYSGSSTQVTIQVMANCETVSPTNGWDYTVHCP
jgi:hypothetical protein